MYVEKCYRNRFKIASKGRVVLMVSAMLSCLSIGHAAPTGGVVTTGSAAISSSGTTTNINQSTQKASINWQGFSIASNETVNFNQPSASSITLNRVVGNETSVIEGALNANGKVFLLNSNGILFTQGSSVNTSGLVASTLNLSDEDFNKNHFVFQANGSQGSVINMGTINIANSGYAALLGKEVSNQGVIVATKGAVALSSGDKITLNFNGDSLMSVTIDEGTLNALVENKNAIYADGGKVILTAKAANDLLASQVNNEGLIQAQTLADLKGEITLYAHGGTTTVDGILDASAPTKGDGGFIETSGNKVKINDSAKILTKSTNGKNGTWLIDPVDFTIAASGGDMSGTFLSNYLNTQGSQTITSTTGSINVNDTIDWDAATTLTLNALNDINVNKTITGQYTAYDSSIPTTKAGLSLIAGHDININNAISLTNAVLSMSYGNAYNIRTKASYSGATTDANGNLVAQTDTSGGVYGSVTFNGGQGSGDALSINGNSYTLIYSMSQLDALNNASGRYALASNFDASGTIYHYALISTLSGTLYGLGHSISNLTIIEYPEDYSSNAALIGEATSTATIRDIGLINVDIEGFDTVGGLVGFNHGSINNAYVTGSVKGNYNVGGLVGVNNGTYDWDNEVIVSLATIKNAWTNVTINLNGSSVNEDYDYYSSIGGLVGTNGSYAQMMNSNALGDVTVKTVDTSHSARYIGGLVGFNVNSTITNSYASGDVTTSSSASYVGGLVGSSGGAIVAGAISNSFALGNVIGGRMYVGGLVGANNNGASITGSYAKGNVSGTWGDGSNAVGGLVGFNMGTIDSSYATGNVSGSGDVNGGLVGNNGGTISHSYATGDVSSSVNNIGGGLAGLNSGTIIGSHATGNVSGESVGGLVGGNSGTIIHSYATGDVEGSYFGGGLVGANDGTITDSYATGSVSGNTNYYVGGLVGRDNGTTTDSTYHDAKAEAAAEAQAILEQRVENATQQSESIQSSTQKDTAEKIAPPIAENFLAQNTPQTLMQNITIIDPTYSATIKTIVIDGKTYVVEDEDEPKK